MTPSEQYMFISASIVREISLLGGSVEKFVSPLVAERLRTRSKDNA
jgi:pantetheine-phosphate adenylyltransferase